LAAVIRKRNVCSAGGLDEIDIGDFVPSIKSRLREELLRRIQVADVVGDRTAVPLMANGAFVLPKAVQQPISQFCDRRDRFSHGTVPLKAANRACLQAASNPKLFLNP
jgi:hypothetical protein